jgi:hypothetical protein
MRVENENYHSPEANKTYFSASQFKAFLECEAKATATLRGEHKEEKTTALLVGSYVDAHFEKTLDLFKAHNPEIFTKSGDLKAEYRHAEYIIERIERDEMFMRYMRGGKQVIITGEWLGVDWKIKMDSYHKGKAIVDLKVMRDFKPVWTDEQGKIPFVEAWGYDIQGAIYQAVEGNGLPFFIAAATKEKPEPDIAIMSIPQAKLDTAAKIVAFHIDRFVDVKRGLETPVRCEKCDYCRRTKVLTKIVSYEEVCA